MNLSQLYQNFLRISQTRRLYELEKWLKLWISLRKMRLELPIKLQITISLKFLTRIMNVRQFLTSLKSIVFLINLM